MPRRRPPLTLPHPKVRPEPSQAIPPNRYCLNQLRLLPGPGPSTTIPELWAYGTIRRNDERRVTPMAKNPLFSTYFGGDEHLNFDLPVQSLVNTVEADSPLDVGEVQHNDGGQTGRDSYDAVLATVNTGLAFSVEGAGAPDREEPRRIAAARNGSAGDTDCRHRMQRPIAATRRIDLRPHHSCPGWAGAA